MKIKFTECNYPLRKDYLEKIAKEAETNYFLALIQEEVEVGNYWNKKTEFKKKIVMVNYHPNVTIFDHDVFYGVNHNYEKEKIIGYCALEFQEQYKEIIKL